MSIFQFLFKTLDDKTNDKLGAYPEKVHVNAMPERRYLKTSRVMALLSAALLCGCFIWGILIFLLGPMVSNQPQLYVVNKRFFRLDPVQRDEVLADPSYYLMEEHIKQYIRLRHTIVPDQEEMEYRWAAKSPFRWFSSTGVLSGFENEKNEALKSLAEGLTTEVKIYFVEKLSEGIWVAEFDKIEHWPENEKPVVKRYRVMLNAAFVSDFSPPGTEEKIKNPLKFQVMEYALGAKIVRDRQENTRFID
ncbi:MAG: VirB8/TrbF family protein [Alphaproteobacteria bacterium]|nr:VirB8/TrbF family protein [Alphaproteobacteria bacterium]